MSVYFLFLLYWWPSSTQSVVFNSTSKILAELCSPLQRFFFSDIRPTNGEIMGWRMVSWKVMESLQRTRVSKPNSHISSNPVLIGIKYCFYWFRFGWVYAYLHYQRFSPTFSTEYLFICSLNLDSLYWDRLCLFYVFVSCVFYSCKIRVLHH